MMHTRISRIKADKSKFFIIYISIIMLIAANNCVLIYPAFCKGTIAVKIFAFFALMPSIVYFIETITTRDSFVEIFKEIKYIKNFVVPRRRQYFATVPKYDFIKIVFVLMIFIIQMAIVCFTQDVINYDT